MDRALQQGGPAIADAVAVTAGAVRRAGAPGQREGLLAAPLALFFLLFFLAPLALLAGISFRLTPQFEGLGLAQYAKFAGDSFNWSVLGQTLLLGVKTVALTACIGVPLGLLFVEAPRRLQPVLLFIIVLPLLTSVVVRTFAWIVILGREGLVNNALIGLGLLSAPARLLHTELGLVVALSQIEMPLMLLPLISVMSRLDPNLKDASAALGRGTLAHALPRDLAPEPPGAGGGMPARLRQLGHRLRVADHHRRRPHGADAVLHLAAGHHALQLAVRGNHLRGAARLGARGGGHAQRARPPQPRPRARVERMARQSSAGDISYRLVLGLLSAIALLILVTPVVVVLITSFTDSRALRFPPPALSLRWYKSLFDPAMSAQIHTAAWNSLVVATAATTISVVLGTSAALAIAGRRTWWAQALDALFMSPLILPTLAFGLAALMFFSTLGVPLSIPLMVVGHVAVIVPFILRTTIASLSQLDRGLLDTSASLGAGAVYTFRRVTLPVIRPGILAGAFIAFMASLDNVSVSLFLAGPETDVLPIRMWSMLESTLDVRTAAVSGVLIFTTALLVVVMDRVVGLTRRIS